MVVIKKWSLTLEQKVSPQRTWRTHRWENRHSVRDIRAVMITWPSLHRVASGDWRLACAELGWRLRPSGPRSDS